MKVSLLIVATALCASCTVPTVTPPVQQASHPVVYRAPEAVHTKVVTVRPAPGSLAPDEIINDGVQSRAAATRYVTSPAAKPDKIHKLATLTAGATRAVHVMETSRSVGKLEPAEVRAARSSVDELRFYLADSIGN